MMFVLGVMLFSSLVMMPQFLQTLMGYTAESAGLVLSGGGASAVHDALGGRALRQVQARYLIAFGWLTLSLGHVLLHAAARSRISFGGQHPAGGAGVRPGIPVRSHQPGLLRRHSGGKKQQRLRA